MDESMKLYLDDIGMDMGRLYNRLLSKYFSGIIILLSTESGTYGSETTLGKSII